MWGWTEELEEAISSSDLSGDAIPARVLSQREDTFTLQTEHGLRWAHPAGVLFHKKIAQERPGVGDWVLLEPIDCPITDEQSTVTITHSVVKVLPRRSCFLREAPGGRGVAQIVCCNVDRVYVVNPAGEVNLNRIERFAVAIAGGGAEPAVILSKADLVDEALLVEATEQVKTVLPAPQVFTSAQDSRGEVRPSSVLQTSFEPGRTYAFVGASGAGKSSLVNSLMGQAVQETGAVREGDKKGRHVTTFRELFCLPNGGLLVDTPGVREFAIWAQEEGLWQVFSDILKAEENCRFSDCAHETEPGCAVRELVERGELSLRRLSNWRALSQEMSDNRERRERLGKRRERSQYRRKVKRDKRFSKR